MASLPNRQGRRTHSRGRAGAAVLLSLLVTGSGVAQASAGGASGSVGAPAAPKLRSAICLTSCIGLSKAIVDSTIQVNGKGLSAVDGISFRSRSGKRRLVAPVIAATETSAQTVVPRGARTGKLRLTDSYGQKSKISKEPLVIQPKTSLRSSGPLRLSDAAVAPNKVVYGSRNATLNYVISSGQSTNDLRVDVVSPSGQVMQSFFPVGVPPNTTQTLAWNGTGLNGLPVPDGWYAFRVSTADGGSMLRPRARASSAHDLGVAVFSYVFPVRGPHDFGSSGARFGAGRAGHTHQGQDIMADCGTPLVAARGGTVQYSGYQGAAGNYLVIDQKGSGEDNAYMHLVEPSPLHTGDKVATGQFIGNVGQTGDATACHLHFEIWSAPGWYEGGSPYDPLPSLQAWDKYS